MFCSSPEKNNIHLYLNWLLYTTIEFRQDKVKKNSKFSKSNEIELYSVDIHAIYDPIVCFVCLR
jgi:hypothetical protein